MSNTYWLVVLLAVVTGAGVPGPGDSALAAAGILASQGRVSLVGVMIGAAAGYYLGRLAGYQLGLRGGRSLMNRPGFLEGSRKKTLAKGDALFDKYPRLAPIAAPSPISGIHEVRFVTFAVLSLVTTVIWTVSTSLVPYLLGGSITEVLHNVGVKQIAVIALIVAAVVLLGYYVWHRRHPSAEAVPPVGGGGA